MINKHFRVAVGAMGAACALTVLLIFSDPNPRRARHLAGSAEPSEIERSADERLPDALPSFGGGTPHDSRNFSSHIADVPALAATRSQQTSPHSPILEAPSFESSAEFDARHSEFVARPRTVRPHTNRPPTPREVRLPPIDVPLTRSLSPAVRFEPLADTSQENGPSQLETRLIGLERQVERIAEQRNENGTDTLRRATDLLQQIQQSTRLLDIERQLERLQPGSSARATNPGANPKSANPATIDSTATNSAAVEPPFQNSAQPARPAKAPLLRAKPSKAGTERFSLQIENAELGQVLEMLGEMAGTNILASPEVKGFVTANLMDVTVEEALTGILRSRGFVHERDGDFLYVTTQAEATARRQAERKLVTKVYSPQYISVQDLQGLVTPLLTPEIGKLGVTLASEVGLPADAQQAGGDRLAQRDALLVQDYPEVIEAVDGVIREMDVPPRQVVIEAMILSVRLTDQMQFGVNFALLNNNNDNLVVSGNGNVLANSSGFPGGGNESVIPPLGQFLANTAGLKYGFVAGDVSGFLNALENITDTNLVAAPQLRVLNKQRAQLIIGQRLSFTTRTFNNNQTIENVNFLDAGTKLILRPFIGPDGLIRMEVHPERSSATINPQTNLPDLDTTEVTTNVMVRDGTTVIIGGLIEETVVESYDQIPLLGSLPLAGRLFRNKNERTDRNELIVLITPRIIHEPEAAEIGAAAAVEQQHRHESFRNDLSPINRHNLARMHFERAAKYFERGELERAANHIDESLDLAKNNLQALRLRTRIREAQEARLKFWNPPPEEYPGPSLPIPPFDGPMPGNQPQYVPMNGLSPSEIPLNDDRTYEVPKPDGPAVDEPVIPGPSFETLPSSKVEPPRLLSKEMQPLSEASETRTRQTSPTRIPIPHLPIRASHSKNDRWGSGRPNTNLEALLAPSDSRSPSASTETESTKQSSSRSPLSSRPTLTRPRLR